MMITTVDVVMRKFFNLPMKGSYEIISLLFVGVVFLGLAYAQSKNEHIQFDFVYSHFSPKIRRRADVVVLALAFIIFAVITYRSAITAVWSWEMHDTILGAIAIVTWPSRVVVPIGTGLLCLRLLVQLWQLLLRRGEKGSSMAKEVKA